MAETDSPPSSISIHAPAWGATRFAVDLLFSDYISIHAPAWGATNEGRFCRLCRKYFNPRTRVGCDSNSSVIRSGVIISIHAPAWGATGLVQAFGGYLGISIHAPAWGATLH